MYFFTVLLFFSILTGHIAMMKRPPVLLIMLDGLRHDYPEMMRDFGQPLLALERVFKEGARSSQHRSIYPSITFPNHHAIQTGLFGESNGIIDNYVKIPKRGVYNMKNQSSLFDSELLKGLPEPLWVTNQRQGGRTGVVLYPLTDAPFNGIRPFVQVRSYWMLTGFPALYPYQQRVEDTLLWLTDPQYNLNFVLLYFEIPDETVHQFGVGSEEMRQVLLKVDSALGYLLDGLEQHDVLNNINIILASDHGMTNYNCTHIFNTATFLQLAGVKLEDTVEHCGFSLIIPKPGKLTQLYNALVDKHDRIHFYLKDEFIKKFPGYHMANTVNADGLFYHADLPFVVVCDLPANFQCSNKTLASHGWNYDEPDMWPILVGRGPAFKRDFHLNASQPFRKRPGASSQVDLYSLMCHLLGVNCAPRNGSLSKLQDLLRPEQLSVQSSFLTSLFLSIFGAFLIICVIGVSIYLFVKRFKKKRFPVRQFL